jgi:phage replisome organizer, putative, N-terminal region
VIYTSEKRFYWLKLKQDFFEQDEIKIVENMSNGKDYIIFLLKLQLKSINTEGHLLFKNAIPYSEEMLATLTNTNIDVVRSALKIFMQLKMVERLDNGTLLMTEVQNLIGGEGQSAERVRRFREKQEIALLSNGEVTNSNTDVIKSNEHIEIDIELDKEKDINNKKAESIKINYADRVKMTEEEYNKIITKYNKKLIDEKIIDLDLWKGSKGKTTKSDYLTLLTWLRKEAKEQPKDSRANAGAYEMI